MKRMAMCGVLMILFVFGMMAAPWAFAATYYVDVKYPGGDSDGTSTKPWTNMGPAAAAFTNGSDHTIMVGAGAYLATNNAGGYEAFGSNGYTVIPPSGNFAGTWKGGYPGWTGASFDWSEGSRVFPRTNVNTSTMTVIDLTNANSRAFRGVDMNRDTLTVTFDGFVFRNASITQPGYDGGALAVGSRFAGNAATAPNVFNCVFLNNRTTGDGGALWHSSRFGLSSNLWFVGNHADTNGGAAFLTAGNSSRTVSNIVCIGNSAGVRGGAIAAVIDLEVGAGTFIGNACGTEGGAVYNGPSTVCRLRQCAFLRNTAGTYGGAVGHSEYRAASVDMENCLVASNNASSGYAVYMNGAYIQDASPNIYLRYTTVADNPNGGVRTWISSFNGPTGQFVLSATNCIIANNGPAGLSASDATASSIRFGIDYNIVYGQAANYHDLATNAVHPNDRNVDPWFAGNGDYILRGWSPAMDTAIHIGITNDLLNAARPRGGGYDRGCYESPPPRHGTLIMLQ